MQIRIVTRPAGEAPEWVRDAWIGLSLPLAHPRAQTTIGFGVLSGPRGSLRQRVAALMGKGERIKGYIVPAQIAIERLASKHPDAAAWWRTNCPHLMAPGHALMFRVEECEVTGDEPAND